MRFYWISKQANHIEIRKTYVRTQDAVFFFLLPTGWKITTKYYDEKKNKKYSRMNMYSVQWLAWTFIRRTFKKRAKR